MIDARCPSRARNPSQRSASVQIQHRFFGVAGSCSNSIGTPRAPSSRADFSCFRRLVGRRPRCQLGVHKASQPDRATSRKHRGRSLTDATPHGDSNSSDRLLPTIANFPASPETVLLPEKTIFSLASHSRVCVCRFLPLLFLPFLSLSHSLSLSVSVYSLPCLVEDDEDAPRSTTLGMTNLILMKRDGVTEGSLKFPRPTGVGYGWGLRARGHGVEMRGASEDETIK